MEFTLFVRKKWEKNEIYLVNNLDQSNVFHKHMNQFLNRMYHALNNREDIGKLVDQQYCNRRFANQPCSNIDH